MQTDGFDTLWRLFSGLLVSIAVAIFISHTAGCADTSATGRLDKMTPAEERAIHNKIADTATSLKAGKQMDLSGAFVSWPANREVDSDGWASVCAETPMMTAKHVTMWSQQGAITEEFSPRYMVNYAMANGHMKRVHPRIVRPQGKSFRWCKLYRAPSATHVPRHDVLTLKVDNLPIAWLKLTIEPSCVKQNTCYYNRD